MFHFWKNNLVTEFVTLFVTWNTVKHLANGRYHLNQAYHYFLGATRNFCRLANFFGHTKNIQLVTWVSHLVRDILQRKIHGINTWKSLTCSKKKTKLLKMSTLKNNLVGSLMSILANLRLARSSKLSVVFTSIGTKSSRPHVVSSVISKEFSQVFYHNK